jgi:hypothetical protein
LLQGDRLCVTLPKKGQCGSTNPTWWWLDSTTMHMHAQSQFSAASWEQSHSRSYNSIMHVKRDSAQATGVFKVTHN